MAVNNDDEMQYQEIKKVLKGLPQVKAPAYFEADLMRKINAGNFTERYPEKLSLWEKLFSPAKLIPASLILIIGGTFVTMFSPGPGRTENPLLSTPNVRSDGGVVLEINAPRTEKVFNIEPSLMLGNIHKRGLNFKQVQLTESEKTHINNLKSKVSSFFRNEGNNKR